MNNVYWYKFQHIFKTINRSIVSLYTKVITDDIVNTNQPKILNILAYAYHFASIFFLNNPLAFFLKLVEISFYNDTNDLYDNDQAYTPFYYCMLE